MVRKIVGLAMAAALMVGINLPQAAEARFKMHRQCRGYNENTGTAKCAAIKNHISVSRFMAVGQCESGWQSEPDTSYHIHHGPLQYLSGTFTSHMSMFPDYRRWNDLKWNVHHVRSQIMIAARHMRVRGWYPWSCA